MATELLSEETYFTAERYYKGEWREELFSTAEEAFARWSRDRATGKYDACRVIQTTTTKRIL